jgi:hypothetical protein
MEPPAEAVFYARSLDESAIFPRDQGAGKRLIQECLREINVRS